MTPLPRLLAITDLGVLSVGPLLSRLSDLAQAAAPGTVGLVLRDHAASGLTRLELGHELKAIAQRAGQQLWVADRLDLALLLAADVLHLGEASVSAVVARRLWGAERRISRAWHAAALAQEEPEAELAGVDALLLSPVLAARKGRPALGLAAVEALGSQLRARNQAYPLYALGGVSAENAAACLAAGATGVAAIGAALSADPRALLDALGVLR